jgi:hypothetical protein
MTHGSLIKPLLVLALAALISATTVGAGIVPQPFRSGLFGIAAGQAVRVSALDAASRTRIAVPARMAEMGEETLQPLFTPVSSPQAVKSATTPGVLRTATLSISSQTLASEVIVNADAHLLNLFTDVRIVAFRSRIERRMRGGYTWFGRFRVKSSAASS